MPEDRPDLRSLDWREMLSWTLLFRGFQVACDLKKIALGAAGALLVSLGWIAIASTCSVEPTVAAELQRFPWSEPTGPIDVFASPLNGGWTNQGIPTAAYMVVEPFRRLTLPIALMFQSTTSAFVGILVTACTLVVWALFGGAITRIATVQVSREGSVSLTEALWFVWNRYLSYLCAPVLPFIAVVFIVFFCLIGGALTRVPGLDIVMGLFWFLALVAGGIITLALLGLALGWPLMYSAISTEATESFDALSRSYSYVLGRPWRFLFYVTTAALYGAIVTTLVATLAYGTAHLSQYAVAWGGGDQNLRSLYAFVPEAGGWQRSLGPKDGELTGGEAAGDAAVAAQMPTMTSYPTALLVSSWTHLLFLGMVGFAYSYFWSAATIIYLLLRRDVDETELDEVYLEEEEEEPFPTVAPSVGPPLGIPEPPGKEPAAEVVPSAEQPTVESPPASEQPPVAEQPSPPEEDVLDTSTSADERPTDQAEPDPNDETAPEGDGQDDNEPKDSGL